MTAGQSTLIAMCIGLLLAGTDCIAQTQNTEHTLRLDDRDARPSATLEDVSWLVGAWTGEAFGSTFEEVWNPASAGSMVGFFKLIDGEEVAFYELMLLVEEAGSLSLKVKHFNADFTAWEDKADYVDFRFIRAEPDALHFSGISFYRVDANTIHAFMAMRHGDEVREQKLIYRRRR